MIMYKMYYASTFRLTIMFNNMKNKIREKTGSDLPKFNASSSLFGKSRSNQHSRQNSQGSISSILSDHSNKDESDTKLLNSNNMVGIYSFQSWFKKYSDFLIHYCVL